MEILVQLTPGNGNPRWPDRLGDGAKVTVEFPFTEDFTKSSLLFMIKLLKSMLIKKYLIVS